MYFAVPGTLAGYFCRGRDLGGLLRHEDLVKNHCVNERFILRCREAFKVTFSGGAPRASAATSSVTSGDSWAHANGPSPVGGWASEAAAGVPEPPSGSPSPPCPPVFPGAAVGGGSYAVSVVPEAPVGAGGVKARLGGMGHGLVGLADHRLSDL